MNKTLQKLLAVAVSAFYLFWAVTAQGYSFNQIVPDMRLPASASGGSSCPVASHQLTAAQSISVRWSTALNSTPQTILTQDQTTAGRLNEIEQVIQESLAVWSNVAGTSLIANTFAPVTRVSTANACGSDGINSICFDQLDMAFTPGVLAFTRVITADQIGIQVGNGVVSTQVGQILDADIYFSSGDYLVSFATPLALGSNPKSYDLESLLSHELGHFLGFSHSAVWNAMMFPYAPAPGTFSGQRPTPQQQDAPLADDDRTGLRVLYHSPSDANFTGSLQGRIVPANPLSLPASPPGVTGIFGSHVVAVDSDSGAVVAAALGGWSCSGAGPAQFDGTYLIEGLPVGRNYKIYAESLNGAVPPSSVSNALATLCRNVTTDPGWPPLQGCVVPSVNMEFTTRTRPSP